MAGMSSIFGFFRLPGTVFIQGFNYLLNGYVAEHAMAPEAIGVELFGFVVFVIQENMPVPHGMTS